MSASKCVVDNVVYPSHKPAEGNMVNHDTGRRELACWCSRCGMLLDRLTGKALEAK